MWSWTRTLHLLSFLSWPGSGVRHDLLSILERSFWLLSYTGLRQEGFCCYAWTSWHSVFTRPFL